MANFLYAQTTPLFLLSRLGSLNPHFDMSRYLEKFGRLETNLDRVNFVYKDLRKFKLFPKSVKCGKSDAESQGLRERGNEAFGEGGYRLALERYTASLAAAKGPGFLALAFANRSACLYKLGRFQECLTDIERAFANNYPERLKPKLIERRKNAEKLLASSKPPQPYHEDTPEFAEFEKHPKIQCAKNCVEIKRNDEFGRHVVATRDITIGEILCVENPYAIILTDDPLIHCAMCLELCYNTIPCDNCLFLLFCSEECKNKANSTFHKYECPILASLVDCGIRDTELVALRVAISARGDYESLSSPNPNVDEEEVYCSNRYKEIHNLMPATDKQDVNDLFEQAVTAALMYHFLRGLTDFFNNDDMKRVFKEVVLLQIQIVDLNQRGLDEKRKLCDSETENFAIGIYAFTSLFNHSCCPNVEQTMYGSAMVLRSVNTIKKDQQCFISYG
ncbi:hypothetical protein Zmor_023093 [Zophobas morio]|uniref:SET domain-containing protein n=2 Tax=Zophobas morio TaxID=2755281 RepID=A0AA38HX96_9CUCU|nr:hypothetical protein Zmor_023093 [Zophobas morio]